MYNLLFHPLRKYPGPLVSRAARLAWIFHANRGKLHYHVHQLHERYGPVVRVAPDELSFIDPAAWKDIYGHRVGAQGLMGENGKWGLFYGGPKIKDMPVSILGAPREEHAFLRKQLSHGFSDKSLRAQESIVASYVDLLILRLREVGGSDGMEKKKVNLADWFAWTTFDIIGDLAFGSSFNCLRGSDYHPWVKLIQNSSKETMKAISMQILTPVWVFRLLLKYGMNIRKKFTDYVENLVQRRMDWTVGRPDLIEGLLAQKKEGVLSLKHVTMNASILVGAGSETTGAILCGVIYLLLTHPQCLEKVKAEVRTAFKSEDEITFASVNELAYMVACLSEALRLYPPIAIGMPRQAMKGGTTIAGHFVPEGTIISVPHYATSRSQRNFTRPNEYRPDRWLSSSNYASDQRDAVQPFMVGPRNCIGKNLAYAEMRLILARILFNFDLELARESSRWMVDQEFYALWIKPALEVYIKPV